MHGRTFHRFHHILLELTPKITHTLDIDRDEIFDIRHAGEYNLTLPPPPLQGAVGGGERNQLREENSKFIRKGREKREGKDGKERKRGRKEEKKGKK